MVWFTSKPGDILYRKRWWIYRNAADTEWWFVHHDFDDGPDGNDPRCGAGKSVADCKDQIRTLIRNRTKATPPAAIKAQETPPTGRDNGGE